MWCIAHYHWQCPGLGSALGTEQAGRAPGEVEGGEACQLREHAQLRVAQERALQGQALQLLQVHNEVAPAQLQRRLCSGPSVHSLSAVMPEDGRWRWLVLCGINSSPADAAHVVCC